MFASIKAIAARKSIFVESSFIKRTELLYEAELSSEGPIDIEVPIEIAQKLRFGASTTVTIALCLTSEKEKTPGKPFRKGHWLAKKAFDISVERDSVAFSIEPLDEIIRSKFHLPEGALYFINYLGGFNEPVDPESPPARVYVAKEIIDRLALATQQKSASIVESFLAAEIASYLLARAYRELGPDENVCAGSPLDSMEKQLKDSFRVESLTIRKWATENDGLTLRAYLHADNQTVRNILQG